MATVVLDRFRIVSGREGRAKEWMRILNERIEECRATLDHEQMYFEAIFSEERDGRLYLYWVELQEPGGRDVRESHDEIDQVHVAFWDECVEPGSRTVMATELVLIPQFLREAIEMRRGSGAQ
jgi:hypothetical protein